MADLVSFGRNATPNIDQALIALKKGSQLLKLGRKGKPKFCPFRLSPDELSLIWFSKKGEKSLKLSSVLRIIPGQRTAVFQRNLRPQKDYLSFSLIYKNGKRSLDLICKDRVEVEVWIAALKALIPTGQGGRSKIDGWNEGGLSVNDSRELTTNSSSETSSSGPRESDSTEVSVSLRVPTGPNINILDSPSKLENSHLIVDHINMQIKGPGSDAFRASVSSVQSTSSHGSAHEDSEALGDIYIWGEVLCDNIVKVGANTCSNLLSSKADVLLPKLLETNVGLDVHHIACGVKHAALVTKQGEIFTWGEESGGRLGHGVGKDVIRPRLVDSLAESNIDFVACGEFHTCAVTMGGELYTWGDGTHNAGILGHGTDISHWIPKRISGPLEGLQVVSVACGPWHTALITSMGQLFTFGDGTFGVLGHGDRESVLYPREVESLSGLRTNSVACGVWHTAAVVEVIVTQSNSSVASGKLFTWGDGDKDRLGHGDKEPRLKPTCVPALIDYDFKKIACGHSLTVGLTTSGNVFTMGSTVYGQLGNSDADGKLPCLVKDKLTGECVEDIACGAYHTVVVTSKNEVYSWGKGANGRLGHGDIEDRKIPTLIEALKDRHVKYIACGSNFTAAICLHKWVSGAEQAQCSACRLAFGFTRKKHNCYNCGLVHCHSCSSKKAFRASLAPNPSKPYRVCDSCHAKLNKVSEVSANNRKNATPRHSGENKDRLDKDEIRISKSGMPSNMDLIKQLDNKALKQGKKNDTFSLSRSSQTPSLLQLRDVVLSTTTVDFRRTIPKPVLTQSGYTSRAVSPFSRKPSPTRSATPLPTSAGLSFSKSTSESLKKTNEQLNQEVLDLRAELESLRQRCDSQEHEIQKSSKNAQEAIAVATEEAAKSKAAKDVIKSLTAQLKEMAERMLPVDHQTNQMKPAYVPNGKDPNNTYIADGEVHSRSGSFKASSMASPTRFESATLKETHVNTYGSSMRMLTSNVKVDRPNINVPTSNVKVDHPNIKIPNGNGGFRASSESVSEAVTARESKSSQDQDGVKSKNDVVSVTANSNEVEAEWIEQYEPGVYITLMALKDGTRDLKRVRFSRRRFGEHQAENWWSENRDKVYENYNVRGSEKSSSVPGQASRRSERATSPGAQTVASMERGFA